MTGFDDFADLDEIDGFAKLDDFDDWTDLDILAGGNDTNYLICFDKSGHLADFLFPLGHVSLFPIGC